MNSDTIGSCVVLELQQIIEDFAKGIELADASKGRLGLHKKQTVVKTVVKLAISGTICNDKGSHHGLNRA